MVPRPAMNTAIKPAKRILFQSALIVSMIGSLLVSSILLLQGGLSLGYVYHRIDIGNHPLQITSAILILLGLITLLTFFLLAVGLIQVHRLYTLIASGLFCICSFVLIILSLWSFLSVSGGKLSNSVNEALIKEIDQTQFIYGTGNQFIIENSDRMARLEKQHQCCGLQDPIEDYRTRQSTQSGSLSSSLAPSTSKHGRTTNNPKSATHGTPSVSLPISCCNEKYRMPDNLCVDTSGHNTSVINRYNTDGCYAVIVRHKVERIQQQGFVSLVTACLSVISTIALAAVLRLLAQVYQIEPLPKPN